LRRVCSLPTPFCDSIHSNQSTAVTTRVLLQACSCLPPCSSRSPVGTRGRPLQPPPQAGIVHLVNDSLGQAIACLADPTAFSRYRGKLQRDQRELSCQSALLCRRDAIRSVRPLFGRPDPPEGGRAIRET
jgi:hypothetical protein